MKVTGEMSKFTLVGSENFNVARENKLIIICLFEFRAFFKSKQACNTVDFDVWNYFMSIYINITNNKELF